MSQSRSSGGSDESHGAFGGAGMAEGTTGGAATGAPQVGTTHGSSTGFAYGEGGVGTVAGGLAAQDYVYGRGGGVAAQARDYIQRRPGRALLFAGAVGFALACFIPPGNPTTHAPWRRRRR